jgi:hypothetical protein
MQKGSTLGNTSGKPTEHSSRRTRASKIQKRAAPTIRPSEACPEEFFSDSSVDSDDTIMREIDEVAEASTEGEEGNSSPTVMILPSDPRTGALSPTLGPRSPPALFEDFAEETTAAAFTEPGPLPQPVTGPSTQLASSSIKQKGKRVTPDIDESPEHKRQHANRDNGFMVSRILAMAKVFTPPSSQNPNATVPSPGIAASLNSSGVPAARSQVRQTTATDGIVEGNVPARKLPPSPSLGEAQDNFSLEFDRLQEEVASEREAFEEGLSMPILPTGPEPSAPVLIRVVPGPSSPDHPISPPLTGPQSNFQTEGLTGCPLEALSSLVTPEYIPQFGDLSEEGYAEQLTGKILQVCYLITLE